MSLSVGTRLGPYEIIAPIGAGGMGEVCRARGEVVQPQSRSDGKDFYCACSTSS